MDELGVELDGLDKLNDLKNKVYLLVALLNELDEIKDQLDELISSF